jgi:hypothetical protein
MRARARYIGHRREEEAEEKAEGEVLVAQRVQEEQGHQRDHRDDDPDAEAHLAPIEGEQAGDPGEDLQAGV